MSAPRPAEDCTTYYHPPYDSEANVAKLIAYNRPEGYRAKLNLRWKYGTADVVIWNDEEVMIYEVKFLPTVNDIAHALGQLLLYREQFKDNLNRKVSFIVYARAEFRQDTYKFLSYCCAKYGVILYIPETDGWRHASDIERTLREGPS